MIHPSEALKQLVAAHGVTVICVFMLCSDFDARSLVLYVALQAVCAMQMSCQQAFV